MTPWRTTHGGAAGDQRLQPARNQRHQGELPGGGPPIYLTGYLEFQDLLGKICPSLCRPTPRQGCAEETEDEWNAVVRRIGRAKLKEDLASYKAVMPKRNTPRDGRGRPEMTVALRFRRRPATPVVAGNSRRRAIKQFRWSILGR